MFEHRAMTLADRLIILGALAFLVGTAAASLLYARDPYRLSVSLFQIPLGISWPFYLGTGGLASLVVGGVIAKVKGP